MKSKTLLYTLAGIAAAVVLLLVGIKVFDGRSVKAIIVRQALGFRALNSAKYDFDKADMTDKSTIEIPDVKFPRPLREYRVGGMQVFEADAEDDTKPVLLYIHGGAYCHNFTKHHWKAMAEWAAETGCGIVAPNYPLLPLHTAIEAHPLMMQLYESLLERCDARRIVISGDSAGGGFSLALAQEIRDAGLPVPARLVLLAPWVDMMGGDASLQKYDNWLMVDTLPRFGQDWAEGLDIQNPMVSPLYGDMHGLPPTDFYAGTWDVLYTDVVKTYEKMKAEGVDVRLHVGEKMPHVYPILPCPEGEAARKEIAEILVCTEGQVKENNKLMVDKEIISELKGRDIVLFVADEGEISLQDARFPVIYTGMGKMRMFNALVKWHETLPDGERPVVLNMGTAGSARFKIGDILNVRSFVNGGSDLIYDRIDLPGDGASIHSGDFFMSTETFSPEEVKRLSQQYDLFDMEAYAAALFCKENGLEFYCIKGVSDNLDGTMKDWTEILGKIGIKFTEILKEL